MEFPSVGANCSWSSCKTLDFLPLTCADCKLIFCKNHIVRDDHECKGGEETRSDKQASLTFVCMQDGCEVNSSVEMNCPKCSNHFCLEHRFHKCFETSPEQIKSKKAIWDASKNQFAESISKVNEIVTSGIRKSMQNPKKQEAAQKINLMRLKGKAKGPNGIPSDKRAYFLIIFMTDSKTQTKVPIFTSKDWSVGRMIDSVADLCGAPNRNNVLNAKKLRLFKRSNGSQVSTDLGRKVGDLISENSVTDGETLILEYVHPSEDLLNYVLSNTDAYPEL